MQAVNPKLSTRGKMQTEDKLQTADWVAWENSKHFAMPPLDPSWNDVWKMSTEIPCVSPLSGYTPLLQFWHLNKGIIIIIIIIMLMTLHFPDLGSASDW